MGLIYLNKKDYDSVIKNVGKAIELKPDMLEAYMGISGV
jgi:Tfp pilus assembly protein PilF